MTIQGLGPVNHLFSLYECMVVAHIATNNPNVDNDFLNQINEDKTFPVFLVPNNLENVDLTSIINDYGRACITSYDWEKLLAIQFTKIWKRPLKILLEHNGLNSTKFVETNFKHDEFDFVSPPLVIWSRFSKSKQTNLIKFSVFVTSTHVDFWKTKTLCVDDKMKSLDLWSKNSKALKTDICKPKLDVSLKKFSMFHN